MKKLFLAVVAFSFILASTAQAQDLQARMAEINEAIQAEGMAILTAEYIVIDGKDMVGRTVYANDRTLTLSAQWAPGDARRLADGNNLTYMTFSPYAVGGEGFDITALNAKTFDTWMANVRSGKLSLVERPYLGGQPNYVLGSLFGFGANPFAADIVTTGFLPGFVFDYLAPGGSGYILGVTFTLIWVDTATGLPTDIDKNGKADIALKEVWYNDAFYWSDGTGPGVDFESIALHENGHALGLGHFGALFTNNGGVHIAPRAVMNAIYLGVLQNPLGTDKGALNSLYNKWPR